MSTDLTFYQIVDNDLVILKTSLNNNGYSIDYRNWPENSFYVEHRHEDQWTEETIEVQGMFCKDLQISKDMWQLITPSGDFYCIRTGKTSEDATLFGLDEDTMDYVSNVLDLMDEDFDYKKLEAVIARNGSVGAIKYMKQYVFRMFNIPEELIP